LALVVKGFQRLTLRGVLIDFGGTLAYLDEAENRRYETALVSTLNQHGFKRYLKDLDSVLGDIYISSTRGELKSLQEFWSLVLRKMKISETPELVKDMENARRNHIATLWKLYDGVHSTLLFLKKRYKLALVSNCAVGTDEAIDFLGLTGLFDCITLSYKMGARKPDKRMYVNALKCLGLEAHECIFVADEISDLEGAKDVGLKTLLVRQGSDTFKDARDPNFRPDFECDHITGVTAFL
jgi:HAD superfamily hydrolase (TIGR01509 family)